LAHPFRMRILSLAKENKMKKTLPFLFGTLILSSFPCFANGVAAMSGRVVTVLPQMAGAEKAVEPFTMAIAGGILLFLGFAGRKHTV
jgi:hypothetical protein